VTTKTTRDISITCLAFTIPFVLNNHIGLGTTIDNNSIPALVAATINDDCPFLPITAPSLISAAATSPRTRLIGSGGLQALANPGRRFTSLSSARRCYNVQRTTASTAPTASRPCPRASHLWICDGRRMEVSHLFLAMELCDCQLVPRAGLGQTRGLLLSMVTGLSSHESLVSSRSFLSQTSHSLRTRCYAF
jgi:hypothetical protein